MWYIKLPQIILQSMTIDLQQYQDKYIIQNKEIVNPYSISHI